MTEEKTCVNCNFREFDCSIEPCKTCNLASEWEPRDNE